MQHTNDSAGKRGLHKCHELGGWAAALACQVGERVRAGLWACAYDAIELDKRSDGRDVQDALQERTGQRTVPNIFVGGGHVGGCDDLMQAEADGTLRKMLEGVGISI